MKTQPGVTSTKTGVEISWANGAHLVFDVKNGDVMGIRDVVIGPVALRNPSRLWRPIIATPDGIQYSRFPLKGVKVQKDGAVVVTVQAVGMAAGIQEEQDEYLGDIINLSLPDTPVQDQLEWEFRPSSMEFGGREFHGFSYRYRFISKQGRQIYRLFDDATWEIGGKVAGNTLLLQGEVNPPVTELTRELFFTTACNYYGAEMTGFMTEPTRVSFQRLPRMGTLQAFDFLTHAKGAMVGLFTPLEEVLSIVQKNKGQDCLHVVDECRRPLSDHFETHPKHILFHAPEGTWKREEQRNLWAAVYDDVHQGVRSRYRVKPSPVLPRIWIPQVYQDTFTLEGKTYPREKNLIAFADHRIDRWADMGAREICMHSIWHSDYTEDRLKFKDQNGMHGGLIVGSICNVRVHEVAPLWGGPESLAYFVKKAHTRNVQVQLWWASHLSRRAPIFTERPDFMLLARDGLPNGGGFGHQSLVTLNLNNKDCFNWVLGNLVKLHEQTGFDGLFHDSYGNMTFLPMNYADPQRRGQQDAFGRLISRLQKAGVKTFTVEGIGPLGVGHFGMNLLPKSGKVKKYQSALNWWLGQEDMIYGLNMGISARPWKDYEPGPDEFSFRCLANGGRFGMTEYDGDRTEFWQGWLRDLNLIHGQFAPLTGQRVILPGDRGVLWKRKGGDLLFAFRAFRQKAKVGAQVRKISPTGDMEVGVTKDHFQTEPWSVYRLSRGK